VARQWWPVQVVGSKGVAELMVVATNVMQAARGCHFSVGPGCLLLALLGNC